MIDIRRIKNIRAAFKEHINTPLSNKKIYSILKSQLTRQEKKSYTQNKAVRLFNSLFDAKRNRNNLYVIKHERTLSDVLQSMDIDSNTSIRIKNALKSTYL